MLTITNATGRTFHVLSIVSGTDRMAKFYDATRANTGSLDALGWFIEKHYLTDLQGHPKNESLTLGGLFNITAQNLADVIRYTEVHTDPQFAHLTKVKGGYELRVSDTNRPVGGFTVRVPGKREARKMASDLGAQPWNF